MAKAVTTLDPQRSSREEGSDSSVPVVWVLPVTGGPAGLCGQRSHAGTRLRCEGPTGLLAAAVRRAAHMRLGLLHQWNKKNSHVDAQHALTVSGRIWETWLQETGTCWAVGVWSTRLKYSFLIPPNILL